MKKLFLFIFVLLAVQIANSEESNEKKCTTQIEITGTIGPATVDYFKQAREVASKSNCSSILVLINTPGGNLQSTRMIVEDIINSPIPILCLVAPSGGHAGSAGAIILQACHVNGAVEATNIGAATPILGTGQNMPEDLRNKMLNDTTSWIDGLTRLRNRDQQFGRDIVSKAKAVDAFQAKEIGAIDVVVSDVKEFLTFADGRKVKMAAGQEQIVKVGSIQIFSPGVRHRILELVAEPEIAYLMFMGSLALLYFEITHPGMILPGVVGGVGLLISLVALHKLDVWWGGIALLLLGIALIIAEAFVVSFGVLGIGGIVAFVIGSLFLFDQATTGYSLPLSTIMPTAIGLGVAMMGLTWMVIRTRRMKRKSCYDDVVEREAKVVSLSDSGGKEGQIEFDGETWKFVCDNSLAIGDKVKIIESNKLVLKVEKK